MRGRRARYSTLLWPSLYPRGFIFSLPLICLSFGALICVILYLSRLDAYRLETRLSERVRGATAAKLSGLRPWQWKQFFDCQQQASDCLKLRLAFQKPAAENFESREVEASAACKICHEQRLQQSLKFYVDFYETPKAKHPFWIFYAILIVAGVSGIALMTHLLLIGRKRKKSGIIVGAINLIEASMVLTNRDAYFSENDGSRIRFMTTPERFSVFLEDRAREFREKRSGLKLAAVTADLPQNGILPIELLRGVYQILKSTPHATFLIDERFFSAQDEKIINMRRLVFKNKSGGSLKFLAWEPTQTASVRVGSMPPRAM